MNNQQMELSMMESEIEKIKNIYHLAPNGGGTTKFSNAGPANTKAND